MPIRKTAMSHARSVKLFGRGSLWRNVKRLFTDSGSSGLAAAFMVLCVVTPTVIIQEKFTVIAGWEILLTALLYLSLRVTSEQE
jgi:hypothetical protein